VSTPADETIESRVTEYAREFIKGYTESIDTHFQNAKNVISGAGLDYQYFPLYGRQLGVDLAIAIFYTQIDFYLFFLDKSDTEIEEVMHQEAYDTHEFGSTWVSETPAGRRIQRVREYLGLEEPNLLQPAPSLDAINIPSVNFVARNALEMRVEGHRHGVNFGNQAGARAESALPMVQEALRKASSRAEITQRYMVLKNSDMSPQDRGTAFEELWRDVLAFYGWKPKKFRIPGEENDFTAIHQVLHILGEVRWFDKPMGGGKMREFLAKLDPRPQTIGFFISHSGVDLGGRSVVRRAANSKTVVIFEEADIEKVMGGFDPGPIFDEKLREAYDYIFERPSAVDLTEHEQTGHEAPE
jgi:hypothetical protein